MMPLNAFSFSNKPPSIPHPIPSLPLFIVPLTLALNAIASFSTFSEGTSIHHSIHSDTLSIVTLWAKRKQRILALNSLNSFRFCSTKRPFFLSSPSKEPDPIVTLFKCGSFVKRN